VITNRVDINQVLMQMRALKAETGNTGVNGYVVKPFTAAALNEKIGKISEHLG